MPRVYDDTRELYFDDLEEGDELISIGRTISETDLVNFAALIGWYDSQQCDAVYAEGTLFKKWVASGLLGLALSNGLCRGCISSSLERAGNLAVMDLNLSSKKPIHMGDTIRIRQVVEEKKKTERKDRGVVVFGVSVINQGEKTVQGGQTTYLLKRRS